MNTFSDLRSTKEQDQIESLRQEKNTASNAALVELGKVSDTKGGWFGLKTDVGLGFVTY